MSTRNTPNSRGYFGIGVYHPKRAVNVGTLWRSAHLFGASFVFTVGRRYRHQVSDTPGTVRHTPLFHYDDVADLVAHLPHATPLIGVELDPRAVPMETYHHPERGCYLLGADDHGLTPAARDACHQLLQISTVRPESMNLAVAGSLVLHHRHATREASQYAV